jgi:arylamine N-acetyltransferase
MPPLPPLLMQLPQRARAIDASGMTTHLAAYLARIGLATLPEPTATGLARLQQVHRAAIPFENIDVLLRRPIAIDSAGVFAKLVTAQRGGYCFEHHRLYADMLAAIGLPSRPLLGRPRLGFAEDDVGPRTHVLPLVELEGRPWIADAGFGGSYVPPLPLQHGAEAETGDGARHRLRHVQRPDGEWLLERAGPRATTDGRHQDHGEWQAQYTFDLAPVYPADLAQASHWTATWPQSRFLTGPIISKALGFGFVSLTGTQLRLATREEVVVTEQDSPKRWRDALQHVFGIALTEAEVAQLNLFPG